MPTVSENEQLIYFNLLCLMALNTKQAVVMQWETAPNESQCIFAIFTYCKQAFVFILTGFADSLLLLFSLLYKDE